MKSIPRRWESSCVWILTLAIKSGTEKQSTNGTSCVPKATWIAEASPVCNGFPMNKPRRVKLNMGYFPKRALCSGTRCSYSWLKKRSAHESYASCNLAGPDRLVTEWNKGQIKLLGPRISRPAHRICWKITPFYRKSQPHRRYSLRSRTTKKLLPRRTNTPTANNKRPTTPIIVWSFPNPGRIGWQTPIRHATVDYGAIHRRFEKTLSYICTANLFWMQLSPKIVQVLHAIGVENQQLFHLSKGVPNSRSGCPKKDPLQQLHPEAWYTLFSIKLKKLCPQSRYQRAACVPKEFIRCNICVLEPG